MLVHFKNVLRHFSWSFLIILHISTQQILTEPGVIPHTQHATG